MNTERTDYDSPWKAALEHYFQEFTALFFPQVHAGIDWNRKHKFLDTELQQVTYDAQFGRCLADKLVEVWCKDGTERWVLVHIEVQSQSDPDFARRMYTYNSRIFDHHNRHVVSLAVLGDESADWRPQCYGYELWGCEVRLKFPIAKLLDYWERWIELEESDNPFAIIVMAHLKTQETRHNVVARKDWKFSLIRCLYERGYQRDDVVHLFEFIDWLMNLPPELEKTLWQELRSYEEVKKMDYITSVERIGYQRGVKEGMEQGLVRGVERGIEQTTKEAILKFLEVRFGKLPPTVELPVTKMEDLPRLKVLLEKTAAVNSLDEFESLLGCVSELG